ncbi:MAG TPA: acyl-CoA dehydrogenase family protein, partial [Rhizomicrobium sp.]
MSQPKNFGFGDDETLLRDSARKFFSQQAGIESLRRLVAGDHQRAYESAAPPAPWDETLWRQIVDLGWTGLAVPEAHGGAAMKMV